MHTTLRISLGALASIMLAALAGAQETAGYDDAALDAMVPPANAWADLTRGRMELVDEGTLRFTIELTALPEMQPGIAYLFVFSDGARDWYVGAYTAPTIEYSYGPWADNMPADFLETTGSYASGAPGIIVVDMPVGALGANVTLLSQPRGYTADIKPAIPGGPIIELDAAEGTGVLIVRAGKAEPATETPTEAEAEAEAEDVLPAAAPPPSTSAATPGLAPFAVAGALAGLALATRRSR